MNIETVNELIQSLESAGELSIKETKVMALAKAYQQLAAENLTMLRLLTDISDNHMEYFSEGEDVMFAGVPLDYVSEINMYVSRDVNAENPFPATDAYLAGIKADGVEDEPFGFVSRNGDVVVIELNGDRHIRDGMPVFVKELREGAK